jgi:hypothetical protein
MGAVSTVWHHRREIDDGCFKKAVKCCCRTIEDIADIVRLSLFTPAPRRIAPLDFVRNATSVAAEESREALVDAATAVTERSEDVRRGFEAAPAALPSLRGKALQVKIQKKLSLLYLRYQRGARSIRYKDAKRDASFDRSVRLEIDKISDTDVWFFEHENGVFSVRDFLSKLYLNPFDVDEVFNILQTQYYEEDPFGVGLDEDGDYKTAIAKRIIAQEKVSQERMISEFDPFGINALTRVE